MTRDYKEQSGLSPLKLYVVALFVFSENTIIHKYLIGLLTKRLSCLPGQVGDLCLIIVGPTSTGFLRHYLSYHLLYVVFHLIL